MLRSAPRGDEEALIAASWCFRGTQCSPGRRKAPVTTFKSHRASREDEDVGGWVFWYKFSIRPVPAWAQRSETSGPAAPTPGTLVRVRHAGEAMRGKSMTSHPWHPGCGSATRRRAESITVGRRALGLGFVAGGSSDWQLPTLAPWAGSATRGKASPILTKVSVRFVDIGFFFKGAARLFACPLCGALFYC